MTSIWLASITVSVIVLANFAVAEEIERREGLSTVGDNFCHEGYVRATGLKVRATVRVHDGDRKGFNFSKASLSPLVFQQISDNTLLDGNTAGFSTSVSCKFKSPEMIADALGQDLKDELSCRSINIKIVEDVYRSLAKSGELMDRNTIVFDEDESVLMGPTWIHPWPYQLAYTGKGKTHFRGKALTTSSSRWMPYPEIYRGVYYCHLVSPEYVAAIISGEVAVPGLRN